ncbi:MAG: H-NS family nucleoid-associated regulatory protein [Arenibacterium sp.]
MGKELSKMSRKELTKLREDIDKELKNAEERERQEALKAAEEAAAKFGFSLSDLAGSGGKSRKSGGKRGKAAPKYRNPEDPSQTWTGLGRKPQWFHNALNNGVDPATLEI